MTDPGFLEWEEVGAGKEKERVTMLSSQNIRTLLSVVCNVKKQVLTTTIPLPDPAFLYVGTYVYVSF